MSVKANTKTRARASEECCPSVLAAPLDERQAADLSQAFAALGDPVRLRLLSLIADAGEVCSCDLLEPLAKAQPDDSAPPQGRCGGRTPPRGEARPMGLVACRPRTARDRPSRARRLST